MSINSLADERRDEVVGKLIHLSESFQYLPRSSRATLDQDMERFLLLAAEKPVQRICIYNNGNGRLCAQRPEHGQAYLNTDVPTEGVSSVGTSVLRYA